MRCSFSPLRSTSLTIPGCITRFFAQGWFSVIRLISMSSLALDSFSFWIWQSIRFTSFSSWSRCLSILFRVSCRSTVDLCASRPSCCKSFIVCRLSARSSVCFWMPVLIASIFSKMRSYSISSLPIYSRVFYNSNLVCSRIYSCFDVSCFRSSHLSCTFMIECLSFCSISTIVSFLFSTSSSNLLRSFLMQLRS
jgi:hypothetical protein